MAVLLYLVSFFFLARGLKMYNITREKMICPECQGLLPDYLLCYNQNDQKRLSCEPHDFGFVKFQDFYMDEHDRLTFRVWYISSARLGLLIICAYVIAILFIAGTAYTYDYRRRKEVFS